MSQRFFFHAICVSILVFSSSSDCWARGGGGVRGGGGGGGGGFSGGVSRGGGGGGFSGGARPSPANFGGGINSAPRPSVGNVRNAAGNSINRAPGGVGAVGGPGVGQVNGGQRPTTGAINSGNRVSAGQAAAANRYNAPSQNDLSGFLGLPSDEGLGHSSVATTRPGKITTLPANGANVDVNYGKKEGASGGQVGGVTVTGPQGNTVGRAAAVGPQGAGAVVGGVQGANGGTAGRGVAVGPNGQVVAGRGAVGPGGYGGGGVVTAGPAGVGAGFTRVTPSGRFTAAAAVRGNYNNWGIYGPGWYTTYPGAWLAAGWTANALWNAATWGSAATYCGYVDQPPVYYDYGTNIVYEDSVVYINGESAGTTEQYYDQAASIAVTGAEAKSPSDGDWLPLGVFAFTRAENPKSDITIQLAVNKEGVIRGNYTDTATKQNQVVHGSVDKQTQRVAFTVGENKTNIIETGLYNLTKEEAPCLIHIGKERTEQWLLIRLTNPEVAAN